MKKLKPEDILDLREYEKAREEFRKKIIELKRIRRIGVGPFISLVFENLETMRFQVQEMARAERIIDEEVLRQELAVYNPLIPDKGEISVTLLIELTSKEDLYEWLPKLVGIETAVYIDIEFTAQDLKSLKTQKSLSPSAILEPNYPLSPDGKMILTKKAEVEKSHEDMLTRSDITSSVHYLKFSLDTFERELFTIGTPVIAIKHKFYSYKVDISEPLKESILSDWL